MYARYLAGMRLWDVGLGTYIAITYSGLGIQRGTERARGKRSILKCEKQITKDGTATITIGKRWFFFSSFKFPA